MRLEGFSVQAIAKDIEKSSQTVATYIKDLTRAVQKVGYSHPPTLHSMSRQDKIELSNLIVDTNGNLAEIQKQLKPPYSAKEILFCLRRKKPIGKKTSLSPTLDTWRRQTGTTIGALADMVGIPRSTMTRVVQRRSHLRLKVAEKIKAITGISLRDLYATQIEAINMEIHQAKVSTAASVPLSPIARSLNEDGPKLIPSTNLNKRGFVCPPKKKEAQA